VRQLGDHRPEVERVVSEGNKLAETSATARVAACAQQLEAKYSTLLDTAKVSFQ